VSVPSLENFRKTTAKIRAEGIGGRMMEQTDVDFEDLQADVVSLTERLDTAESDVADMDDEIQNLHNQLEVAKQRESDLEVVIDEAEGNVDDAVSMLKDVSERLSRARLGSA